MDNTPNRNLITALYCRLSVEDMREGESQSIENQKMILQQYADDHGGSQDAFQRVLLR